MPIEIRWNIDKEKQIYNIMTRFNYITFWYDITKKIKRQKSIYQKILIAFVNR